MLVDETYRILHISEAAGRYLKHPGGVLTSDLLRLVREELRFELRTALFQALEENKMVVSAPVFVQFNGTPRRVIVAVRPRTAKAGAPENAGVVEESGDDEKPAERLALVFFVEDQSTSTGGEGVALEDKSPEREPGHARNEQLLAQMEGELRRLRARLQATVEGYESSNEELKAANEELQSINEEYRSTTEELDTSKEELHR